MDRFPILNFDWLSELPERIDASRDRTNLKSTLSDLKSTNPDDLENTAAKLLRQGFVSEGLKLQTEARNRRTLDQKNADIEVYRSLLPNILRQQGGGQAPAQSQDADPIFGGSGQPQRQPPAADPFAGPQGAIPGVGPRSEAPPSPSEQLLQQAQQGAQPRGPQLAGPPPTPDTPLGLPAFMAGAQAQPLTTQPPGGSPPPAAAQGALPPPTSPDDALTASRGIAQQILTLSAAGKAVPPGATQLLMSQFRDALDRTKMTPEQKQYNFDRLQMITQNPDPNTPEGARARSMTMEDWKLRNTLAPDKYKAAIKVGEEYNQDAKASRKTLDAIEPMQAILRNPNFISGESAGLFARGISSLNGVIDIARQLGVSEKFIPDTKKLTSPAALAEAFEGLSNQMTIAQLGGLGNQISNADRDYIRGANPSLMQTKEGAALFLEVAQRTNENKVNAAKLVRAYKAKAGDRADADEIHSIIERYGETHRILKNEDGSLTELGQRLERLGANPPPNASMPSTAAPSAGVIMRQSPNIGGPGGSTPAPQTGVVSPPAVSGGGQGPVEGDRRRGPDGRIYIWKNGQPVPEGSQGL